MLAALFPQATLLRWRRQRLARQTSESSLKAFLQAPLPDLQADWRRQQFLVIDFETTGLDAERDKLLSMGWVVMNGPEIELGSAHYNIIRPDVEIPEQSAVIHGITDDKAAYGIEIAQALSDLLAALTDRILVAHNARLEMAFLQAACQQLWGGKLALPVIDTMTLARQSFEKRHLPYRQDALRLDSLRQRFGLPRYRAHHALNDALATAELFAALVEDRLGPGETLPVSKLLAPIW